MPRTDVTAAINSTIDPVVTYHTDPRGAGMAARLAASIGDVVAGRSGQWIYRPTTMFSGYAHSVQDNIMIGAARLGTARTVAPRSSTITAEKSASPLNDLASQIFYERMLRRRG